ncbi:DUF6635 family protein [Paracoccus aminovorans]|uniref:DUF6635 family protein n=1 Tax=Paracoccus aminovorans TaxID=34004 RepID=UPI0007802BFE|nr:DUF6635 family protein [Paracoccus aminovorans]MDQ7777981.1 hypothetical protein [Paracoccus aminovorans]
MQPADTRPMTRRETEVRRFARARFGLRGTLALHRHALGLDLLRAPVNVMLSPVFLLTRLAVPLLRRLGATRAAGWMARRRIFLPSDLSHHIAQDLTGFIAALDAQGLGPKAPPEAVARATADYAETRNAVSEITTSILVLLAGLLLFHRATPGVISLAGPLADMRAQSQAIQDFALGSWAGGLWYSIFPRELSTLEVILTGVALAVLASVLTTFAGLIADPLQLAAGTHRRRIMRLLSRLDRAAEAPALEREHLLARLGDLTDACLSLWRSLKG